MSFEGKGGGGEDWGRGPVWVPAGSMMHSHVWLPISPPPPAPLSDVFPCMVLKPQFGFKKRFASCSPLEKTLTWKTSPQLELRFNYTPICQSLWSTHVCYDLLF